MQSNANTKKDTRKMHRTRYPGIFKRDGRFVLVSYNRGKQKKSSHKTLAEAKEAQAKYLHFRQARPASRQLFENYARDWIASYRGRTNKGLAKSTSDAYKNSIKKRIIPSLRGYKLAEIERRDVRAIVSELEQEGLASSTIRKYLAPLKALFATAINDGDLQVNPAAGLVIAPQTDAPVKKKAMTKNELVKLRKELPKKWWLLFDLLAHTGLRISEILGLDWDDLTFTKSSCLQVQRQCYRGELKILKTTYSPRDLPLSLTLAQQLWAERPAHGGGALFSTINGTRYEERNVRRILNRAREKAELDWVTFQTYRHTCASMLLQSGKTIRQVSAWLGHSDPSFTLRTYVHLIDDELGDPPDWNLDLAA